MTGKPARGLKIEEGRMVRIAYRILDTNGNLLEERSPENPYEYRHGDGQIVGPVERGLAGKTSGYRAEFSVTPRDGYGPYDPGLVAEMPRSSFPNSSSLTVGMKFSTVGPSGAQVTVRIIELKAKTVTVDGNHPLAGLDLIFEVHVLDVFESGVDPESEDDAIDDDVDDGDDDSDDDDDDGDSESSKGHTLH